MKYSTAALIAALCTTAEAFVAPVPRSGTQNKDGRRKNPCSCTQQSSASRHATPAQRLTAAASRTSTSNTGSGNRHQPTPTMGADNPHEQKLVLREFSVALEASPVAYERSVRAACLREGGEAASVVRWHISRADQETGQAHIEVRGQEMLIARPYC